MFLGLPAADQLVRGTDPDLSFYFLLSRKNSKKNLDSYCFVTFISFYLSKKMM